MSFPSNSRDTEKSLPVISGRSKALCAAPACAQSISMSFDFFIQFYFFHFISFNFVKLNRKRIK